ncbi:MAG TPA: DUF1150 family protein [Dongiaceae bacterium]|jgi:hypothetical protein|nr:DUF1150 family protein [Dongiaceae bacterium]
MKAENVSSAFPLPSSDFLDLGLPEIAYIRDVAIDGRTMVSLYAANGRRIALTQNRKEATTLALQNGLVPLTLH